MDTIECIAAIGIGVHHATARTGGHHLSLLHVSSQPKLFTIVYLGRENCSNDKIPCDISYLDSVPLALGSCVPAASAV